jgi:AcrR family transcriptional regulator
MRAYQSWIYHLFKKNPHFRASERECAMWVFSFMILLSNFVGGAALYREALGMANDSAKYITFVKECLNRIFYHPLKALIYPESFSSHRAPFNRLHKTTPNGGFKTEKEINDPSRTLKGNKSRKMIIIAARQVFSRNPYNKATIRQIGTVGDFDCTLFYNYFPSKAILFETVVMELYEEVVDFLKALSTQIPDGSIREKLSYLIDQIVDYFFNCSDLFMIFMQDIGHVDKLADIPGIEYLPKMIMELQQIIHLQEKKASRELRIIAYGFGILLINCLGSATIHSDILQLEPGTNDYKMWFKDMLMFIFYPSIKKFMVKWGHLPELKLRHSGSDEFF